jgi:hypothetical protein
MMLICCSAANAWGWIEDLTYAALDGDPDAARCLPAAIGHWLRIIRWAS